MTRGDVVTEVTTPETEQVWSVDSPVFGDQPSYAAWRAGPWDRHVARAGFRLARAHKGDSLVGFAYGYTGEHGQWWTDRAAEALGPEIAATWLAG